jgi:hypothetical protein
MPVGRISSTYCVFTVTSTLTNILLLTGVQELFAHSVLDRSMKVEIHAAYRSESCLALDTQNVYMPEENG